MFSNVCSSEILIPYDVTIYWDRPLLVIKCVWEMFLYIYVTVKKLVSLIWLSVFNIPMCIMNVHKKHIMCDSTQGLGSIWSRRQGEGKSTGGFPSSLGDAAALLWQWGTRGIETEEIWVTDDAELKEPPLQTPYPETLCTEITNPLSI